ncbi:switch-associated protein 70-like isoform X2 [Punica granatum]|uniref:Switch-associated protein 70-like isoform X2 n=1 Tax=Punica granatum TaxID=22663 RepID=A0A6P8CKS1_PUNGR|nr:switch-associated protein 70-like isoform X2 [Punica granatum]
MASNGASAEQSQERAADVDWNLEKIKRRLTSTSDKTLLQGPLLKRSYTLKKWNERWVILDPITGRMEYKVRRNEPSARGIIEFDDSSTITLSPVNFHGLPKYDGCCFYIGTPSRKDYLFVAETPGAARAWVSTLQATQLVLRAHKEAVNALSGDGSSKFGTLAAAISAANSTALECSKEIEAAMQISMRNALGVTTNTIIEGPLDDFTIMKETLRVKDEELQNLAHDIRARDSTIKDLAGKLSDTAEAAESAASAVRTIDQQRKMTLSEIGRLTQVYEEQLDSLKLKLKESEEMALALDREREELIKQRDAALQEAELLLSELAKAREHASALEAALLKENEKARVAEAETRAREKEAEQKESESVKDKQEFLAYVNGLQAELQRVRIDQDGERIDQDGASEEKMESCSQNHDSLTKHVNSSEESGDMACVSVSKTSTISEESVVHRPVDRIDFRSVGEGRTADQRDIDINADKGGCGMDSPAVSQNANDDDDDDEEHRVQFTSLKDLNADNQ